MSTQHCPRCAHGTIGLLFASPDPGIWEVLRCERCLYCWRTTEPDRRTSRDHYPDTFTMTAEEIGSAPHVPPIPPLRTR
ncbi:hypothetical protein E1200_07605 [Actinomadura sp. GC306]|uniref:non-oxidative hydroxyarylic acid decarboxylases subunit D n=1 Tax=Actinomadura sp. GC306 TaxID=2530367 RepID=UPI00104B561A|nr:non-oxidative hydroxyarylic acid decarboxylases subunit D [Actinomadura sp. GC306]TDC69707.1 hypothetical protein E1200_07605 [Actinomadura sp. GC306]